MPVEKLWPTSGPEHVVAPSGMMYLPGVDDLIPTEAGTEKILVGNVFDLYESKGEIVGGI